MHTLVASSSLPPLIQADALAALTLKGQTQPCLNLKYERKSFLNSDTVPFITRLQFKMLNLPCNLKSAPELPLKSV
jgi:hypothetical protein